ncbi:helix-turn-helix transcriptional regulator [Rhodococcus sp. 1139]|uniref:helix-turn-helix transcriptional regulator n=1 Tax=Rhodococcus sp. 1139 TaxID=1833762 RepID=UPI00114C98A7|nr:helix-turn-helix transcriptional regulator [Rhodococcus sp. 1139]
MAADSIRITPAVQAVLALLLRHPEKEIYGYRVMDALGYSSGKTYRILARLTGANWLVRHDPGLDSVSGKPRVTYSIAPAARSTIKAALADARERERRGSRFRAHGPRLPPSIE